MKSETTKIDLWIKKRLQNEVIYRVTIWSIVSTVTYLILAHSPDFSVMPFFKSYMPKQLVLLNIAFPLAVIFTFIALLFKDMSVHEESIWEEHKLLGIVGMIVRKVCAEALLWSAALSYGVFLIIAITLMRVLPHESSVPLLALGNIAIQIVFFLLITTVNLFFYCFIRKDGGTFLNVLIPRKKLLLLIYIALILVAFFYMYVFT